jgi:Restriction endonuclease
MLKGVAASLVFVWNRPPMPSSSALTTVTRDDILRAERERDAAQARWQSAGRLRVRAGDVPATEALVTRLTADWYAVELARLPLDRLEQFEADARTARRRLRTIAVSLIGVRFKAWFWSYFAFLQQKLSIGERQLWVLSLLTGIWGPLVVGLVVVLFGLGLPAFAVCAVLSYLLVGGAALLPLLRAQKKGITFVRADLGYRTARARSQRDEARANLCRLEAQCGELRRGRDVRRQLEAARTRLTRLRENAACQAEFDRVSGELERLRRVLGSVKYDLLATDWRPLRGIPFEEFLARIFRSLGYQVQLTKTTGDQGVDLIVTRNGRRIAVQAKGYDGSVGNDSVQQAHTGMAYYGCDGCAVITNSRFTRAAEDLAGRVHCTLIDGDRIAALINGQLF